MLLSFLQAAMSHQSIDHAASPDACLPRLLALHAVGCCLNAASSWRSTARMMRGWNSVGEGLEQLTASTATRLPIITWIVRYVDNAVHVPVEQAYAERSLPLSTWITQIFPVESSQGVLMSPAITCWNRCETKRAFCPANIFYAQAVSGWRLRWLRLTCPGHTPD